MLIGKRIKSLRVQRKMKLIDLAERTGIQIATLSRMEHEKMTGTLASHIKIAKALEVELTDLYEDIVRSGKSRPDAVYSHSKAQTFTFNKKASYEILTNNVMDKKMVPVMMLLEPNGQTNKEQGRPGSERFIFVLKGKIEAHIGEQVFTLRVNNSLYFSASFPHRFENKTAVTVKFLSVTTPVAL